MDMPNGPTGVIYFMPDWFHDWNDFDISRTSKGLLLANDNAWLRITRSSHHSDSWRLQWMIYHTNGNLSQGVQFLTTLELRVAFRLTDLLPPHITHTLELVKGKFRTRRITLPGYFVRNEIFLNIPGAGAKDDCDPNLSITIQDDIKEAIRQLIND